jgi:hypothetical protein
MRGKPESRTTEQQRAERSNRKNREVMKLRRTGRKRIRAAERQKADK